MILEAQLSQLEDSQLIRRSIETESSAGPGAGLAYLFKHTLTQETAYESLLLKKRREVHSHVARAYERFYSDRLDEFAALLAQHYGAAGDDAKTLEYEIRAGDVAARKYANAEAVAHYSRGLEIAQRGLAVSPSQVRAENVLAQDLYLKRGRALELSGRYTEALAGYADMDRAARARGGRALELASLMARATLRATPTPVHDPAEARLLLDQALALARELGDPGAEAKGLWNMMLLSKFTGYPRAAVEYGEQALALARKFDLREQMAFALNDLALHGYQETGQFRRALAALVEARQLWSELDNQPMLADSLGNSALVHHVVGEFDEALEEGQEARRISERIGNLWGQSYSRFVEGSIYAERGEVEQAIKTMQECIALGEKAGFVAPAVLVRSNLAWLNGTMGQIERGIELARLAQQTAETQLPVWRAWPLAVLARLQLLRGQIHESEEILGGMEVGSEADYFARLFLPLAMTVAFARADFLLAQGDPDSALAIMDALVAHASETRVPWVLAEAFFIKAQALVAGGRLEQARGALSDARVEAEAVGSRRMLWRILAAAAKIEAQGGDEARASESRSRALEIVEYIAENSPPDMSGSFLRLPSIRDLESAA